MMRIVAGVPAGTTSCPLRTIAFCKCTRTKSPLLEPLDEIESSNTKIRLASKGKTLLGTGDPVGVGLGDDGGGEGGTGKARTVPAPVARMNTKMAPAAIGRPIALASFALSRFRGGALAFFDELLDF